MAIEISPITSEESPYARNEHEIINAHRAYDLPGFPPLPWPAVEATWHTPWPGRLEEHYLALLDGEPAGRLMIGMPTMDNLDNAFFDINVRPELRRRGIGSELLQFVINRVTELGRTRVMSHSAAPLPGDGDPMETPAAHFATKFGFKPALPEVRRVLDLGTLDHAKLDRMLADAYTAANGEYRLVQWIGPVPDELINDVAYLEGRLAMDAPMGDLAIEQEQFDAERIRGSEQAEIARGRTSYNTGLVHIESGRLASWTAICTEAGVDWHAWQQITIVDPDHRGHRLGTIVKVENLRLVLREVPGLTAIGTFNAAANSYMIAINEAMGFRPMHAFENWQREL